MRRLTVAGLCSIGDARNVVLCTLGSLPGIEVVADRAKGTKGSRSEDRRHRLAAALRANLSKRKEQARARAGEERAPLHQVAVNPNGKDC
jgi:hypothetical protein